MPNEVDTPWYKEGVRFKCTGCGRCCTKEPGYVFLTEEDIERLSSHFGLSREKFLRTYTRFVFGRYSLREMPVTYDCIFLEGTSCKVYTSRPKQCRKFPFWQENFSSKEAWQEASLSCEGIEHKEGELFSKETIEERLEE